MQWITQELFEQVLEQARRSPRRRMNFNFHSGLDENPHRFLNVLVEGTYVRPHRHLDPPKAEAFLALEGAIAFFVFDDSGNVRTRRVLGREGLWGVDIPPGVWHSMAVLTPYAVCYEVKPGPYRPLSDKEFAPWAPAEGVRAAAIYFWALMEKR